MNTYFISLFAISAAASIAGYLSYGEKHDKALKSALAIILVYFIASPTVTLVTNLFDSDFHKTIFSRPEFSFSDTEFSENAEVAFAEGIVKFVSEEFSLSAENIEVFVIGFDAKSMKAEKVKIILKGGAALADNREIADRIEREGLGACEVELEF